MRSLEMILTLVCLAVIALGIFGLRTGRAFALGLLFLPLVVLFFHLWWEGGRWHMGPIYGVAGGLALLGVLSLIGVRSSFPSWLAFLAALGTGGLVAVGVALAWVFPVFSLPKPAGPYEIGTCEVHLTDSVRLETNPKGAGGKRELMVQFWYPAKAGQTGEFAPYLPLPGGTFDRFSNVALARTHARKDGEVAATPGGWPVIIYSPSWGGGRWQNTFLCEALASAGFVVAAIDHPYISPRVKFPDGRIITNEGLGPFEFCSEESVTRFPRDTTDQLEIRTADVLQVFAAVNGLESGTLGEGRFQGRLNSESVGVAGYSFGGAVAAEACWREPRLRAGLNLDGTLFGEAAKNGARQPFLFITDDEAMPSQDALTSPNPGTRRAAEFSARGLRDQAHWLQSRGGWLVQISSASHENFCDQPLYSPLHRYTGAESRDGRQVLAWINILAVSFFDLTLRGESSDFWKPDFRSSWPGVEFQFFPSNSQK